ncbi:PA14 domain-containing protein, partial [Candidatus Marinimicrobia bacterium]|nr:PA14 domain-containing protein [Candidatus Neomarinimicrobiota bacterium]
ASENSHNLALKKDGTVVAWGYNGYGESTVPFDLSGVVDIVAGYRSSFALKSDGTVVGWGSNDNNTLGIPEDLTDVVALDAAYWHVLALKSDGTVVTWGWNGYDLQTVPEGLDNVVAISASGDGHSLALISDGTVVGWGRTNEGQVNAPDYLQFSIPCTVAGDLYDCTGECGGSILTDGCGYCGGAGDDYVCSCDEDLNCSLECSGETNCFGLCGEVSDELCLAHENKNLIASGAYHSFALQTGGKVTAWGRNASGETTVPEGLSDVVQIAGGRHHTLALKSDGTVEGWGWNNYGQATPPVGLTDVVSVSAGYYHSLALKSDGTVVGWGLNDQGQIDIPLNLTDVVAIDAGHHKHNLALKKDGTVVAWGYDGYGESTVPSDLTDVVALSGSYHTSLALKSDGTVVGWGLNNNGILNIPEDLSDVVAIDAGYYHALALKSDGSLVTWGWNGYDLQTIPEGFGNAVAVSASGDGHSFALESINKILGWGRNSEGQINAPGSLELAIPCDSDGTIYDCLGTCGIVEQDECGVCDGPGAIYDCGCSDIPEGYCDCSQENSVNDVCGNITPLTEGLFSIEYFSWSNDYYVNCIGSSCFQDSYASGESNDVNFNGDGSFPGNTSTGSYMSRTTGLIYAEEDGVYTFRADADDGFRLYVDNNLVIDNWFSGAIGSQSNDYFLSSGYHNLRLEHYDQGGHSDLALFWTTPSASESLVQAASGGGYCDCDCNILDGFGVCGGDAIVDCLGVTNGTASLDACGNCLGDCTEDESGFVTCGDSTNNLVISDCAGVCGGILVVDCAGECGGSSVNDSLGIECCELSEIDCLGLCGGTASLDACGNCLGDCAEDESGFVTCGDSTYNTVTSDCAGVCGGDLAVDSCGVCDGDGIADGSCDCDGNTLDALDVCGGTCAADTDNDNLCDDVDDCVGQYDECGVCQGENVCAGLNCDVGESEALFISDLPFSATGSNEGLDSDLHYSTTYGGGDYIYSIYLQEPAYIQFSMCGTVNNHGLDPYVSLYTGEDCDNLYMLSANDDGYTGTNSQFCDNPHRYDSFLAADLSPGQYYFVVGGYSGGEGTYDLYIEANSTDSNTLLSAENSNEFNHEEHVRALSKKSGQVIDMGPSKIALPVLREDCFVIGPDADCSGVCFGTAEIDGCGICDGDNYFNQSGEIISNGACGCPDGNGEYPSIDCDGVCGGENQSCNSCWSNDEESLVCM